MKSFAKSSVVLLLKTFVTVCRGREAPTSLSWLPYRKGRAIQSRSRRGERVSVWRPALGHWGALFGVALSASRARHGLRARSKRRSATSN